jgi:proline racemase
VTEQLPVPTPVTTVDYHTAGEPFRIVTGGVPALEGDTVAERRRWASEHLDGVRAWLCREPRGHADMYGGFVTPADDGQGDLGVVFFHNDGFSTACGHGTIALATWMIETAQVVVPADGELPLTIDVPSGRVRAIATIEAGRATSVRFRNVPAHVHALDVPLILDGAAGPDEVTVDVAYGGAFYASIDAAAVGLSVTPQDLPELIALGRAVQRAADAALDLRLPDASGDEGLYGLIVHERLGDGHQRNVTIFADGQVDRSPCGSGTSARLAILAERGELGIGGTLLHDSIVGTRFTGRVLGTARGTGATRYDTEVEGRASRTGEHVFVQEPDDELGLGFLLR